MMKKNILNYSFIYLLFVISTLNCSQFSNSSLVRISFNLNNNQQAKNIKSNFLEKLYNLFINKAYASIPSDIKSISLVVTGKKMRTLKQYYHTPTDILIRVPCGYERIFSIIGKNSSGKSIYFGSSEPVDIQGGDNISLIINMFSWGKIYVANEGSNNVSVIDGETDTVSTTIPIGTGPFGVGINNSTKLVYVSNSIDDTFHVINGRTDSVVGGANTLCGSCEPKDLGVNPDTNKIYAGSQYNSDTVVVIDGQDNSTSTISVSDCYPYGVDINRSTEKVYVSLWCGTISIINANTDVEISSINVGLVDPFGVAVNSVTNKIYVANNGDNSVNVINGNTDTLLSGAGYPISVGNEPHGIAVNSVTNKIYVANQTGNSVSVIDGSTDTVIDTVPVGTTPIGVAINPGTNKIYVSNSGTNNVSVIDGETDTVTGTINVGTSPKFMEILY